jgi:hypothetical protein
MGDTMRKYNNRLAIEQQSDGFQIDNNDLMEFYGRNRQKNRK